MYAPPSATEQATLVLHRRPIVTVIVDLFLIAYFGYKLRGFRSEYIPVTHSAFPIENVYSTLLH